MNNYVIFWEESEKYDNWKDSKKTLEQIANEEEEREKRIMQIKHSFNQIKNASSIDEIEDISNVSFGSLNPSVQKQYLERLRGLTFWKLRIGDYRAVIHIASNEQKLVVLKIGHRRNIYEKS